MSSAKACPACNVERLEETNECSSLGCSTSTETSLSIVRRGGSVDTVPPPSWVLGPSVHSDPRGGPSLPDQLSFSARRWTVIPRGDTIVSSPDVFSVRHPGCKNGNASLKSGQRVAIWPNFPHEKQTTSVHSRRCCHCRGDCCCRCRCPSSNERNICSSVFGTGSLTSCCNRPIMSDIFGFRPLICHTSKHNERAA